MRRFAITSIVVLAVFGFSGIAGATSYTFEPESRDLYDLEHGHAYSWGTSWDVPDGETIVGASLVFDDIRNWNSSENDLWVRLLDNAADGVTQYYDGYSAQVDYFDGQGTFLNQWHNISSTASDITYAFDTDEIAALSAYTEDGNFGLSFDPDCHFYNNGVSLEILTEAIPTVVPEPSAVPEPSTILLLSCGLLGLMGFKRTKK